MEEIIIDKEKAKIIYKMIEDTLDKMFEDREIKDRKEDYYKSENDMYENNYQTIMFKRLAVSLQNTGRMSKIIKLDFYNEKYKKYCDAITTLCCNFNVDEFVKKYEIDKNDENSVKKLLKELKVTYKDDSKDTIKEKEDDSEQEKNENTNNSVQDKDELSVSYTKYCHGLIDGAKYIKGIDFDNFSKEFFIDKKTISNPNDIDELVNKIQKIQDNIKGFGFALTCDWLKEIGCEWLAKPDVHIKAICEAIDPKCEDDKYCVKFMNEMAKANDISTYKLDKMMWLIGSQNFYLHKDKNGSYRDFLIRNILNI